MRLFIGIALVLLLGCDTTPRPSSRDTEYSNVKEACLDGVVYYSSYTRMGYRVYSAKFNKDSKVETCKTFNKKDK